MMCLYKYIGVNRRLEKLVTNISPTLVPYIIYYTTKFRNHPIMYLTICVRIFFLRASVCAHKECRQRLNSFIAVCTTFGHLMQTHQHQQHYNHQWSLLSGFVDDLNWFQ